MHAKSSRSCLTLCDPTDYSLPGSSVHEILQARILEWVAVTFSRASTQLRNKPRSPSSQADSLLSESPEKSHHKQERRVICYLGHLKKVTAMVESCCCSVAKLCPTHCDPMDYSTTGFPILHYLPEFAQIHVH